jgi:hypothetical protein
MTLNETERARLDAIFARMSPTDRETLAELLANPEDLFRRIATVAHTRTTPWVMVLEVTMHGSGMSKALYEIFKPEGA